MADLGPKTLADALRLGRLRVSSPKRKREELARSREPTLTLWRPPSSKRRDDQKMEHRVQHPAKIRSGTKFAEIAVKVLLADMDMRSGRGRPEQTPDRCQNDSAPFVEKRVRV